MISKRALLLLLGIIVGVVLRSYNMYDRFYFGHDGDLYSWVVKDILVDHHLRLIGQLTSSPGIFIGALFYYLLTPFFFLNQMDPSAVLYLGILTSSATMVSLYFVFKRCFDQKSALIAVFLHAILLSRISFDMWIVPTMFMTLWSIWFLYVLIQLYKGNFKVLTILAVLIGLIWHISFVLVLPLLAVPFAIFFSQKKPTLKNLLIPTLVGVLISLPLILFEFRHGFSQTKSLIESFTVDQGGGRGLPKLMKVIFETGTNASGLFFLPYKDIAGINRVVVLLIYLLLALGLVYKKIVDKKVLFLLLVWIVGTVGFFTFSTKQISEYYLESLNTVFFALVVLGLAYLFQQKLGRVIVIVLMIGVSFWTLYNLTYTNDNTQGYFVKKSVVQAITADAEKRHLPCFAISYITNPGENFGFRYLFYLQKSHIIHPSAEVPVYTIIMPLSLVTDRDERIGPYGILYPVRNYTPEEMKTICQEENRNLTDSLFGYTE